MSVLQTRIIQGDSYKTMKVVVTGGSGFIGSHLVERLLKEGHHVHVIDNLATGRLSNLQSVSDNENLKIHDVDITNVDALNQIFNIVDWVFHLAALADIVPSIENPLPYHLTNVSGTLSVLEAARHCEVKKLVYAASSLTGPFTEIEDAFEKAVPQVDVRMVFAGSQALRLQIEQGALADVFASANQTHMDALIRGKHIEKSHYFASNELALIVPNNNPAGVETLADLASTSLLVLGSDNVPVGTYTEQLLDRAELELGEGFKARVQDQAVSFENNVRLVRSKVEMGEANAAIVYLTESMSPSLKIVSIPGHLRVPIRYPV